jgi:hypothetical protein
LRIAAAFWGDDIGNFPFQPRSSLISFGTPVFRRQSGELVP